MLLAPCICFPAIVFWLHSFLGIIRHPYWFRFLRHVSFHLGNVSLYGISYFITYLFHSYLFKSLNISSCQLIHNYIIYNCTYIQVYMYHLGMPIARLHYFHNLLDISPIECQQVAFAHPSTTTEFAGAFLPSNVAWPRFTP